MNFFKCVVLIHPVLRNMYLKNNRIPRYYFRLYFYMTHIVLGIIFILSYFLEIRIAFNLRGIYLYTLHTSNRIYSSVKFRICRDRFALRVIYVLSTKERRTTSRSFYFVLFSQTQIKPATRMFLLSDLRLTIYTPVKEIGMPKTRHVVKMFNSTTFFSVITNSLCDTTSHDYTIPPSHETLF